LEKRTVSSSGVEDGKAMGGSNLFDEVPIPYSLSNIKLSKIRNEQSKLIIMQSSAKKIVHHGLKFVQ
jgi:hypothetical protein